MHILIVDDHEENLYLLESLLKGSGHAVHRAANGAEAMLVLEKGGIDLIVSDILMPVMDGFELCRKVKTSPVLCRIPLIIYTATYTGPKDEALAARMGADRFIVKPCEPVVFMAAVDEVLAAAVDLAATACLEAVPEEGVSKLYNERLVRKLEQKMAQAEREIKARQAVEQSLRESEEKYRTILDNIEAGYFEVDLAGNLTGFNASVCRILGYAESELMGMNNRDFMDAHNARKVFETFNRVLVSGEPARAFDWRLVRKDGNLVHIDTSVAVSRDADGHATGFRGIARDITERKNAEAEREELQRQLIQAQKLESVGRLAGGVAHDFNNILSVVMGYAELALDDLDPQEPLHADLKEIMSAALRSRDITRQLLAFARRETIAPEVLDLNETVENLLKMLRRLIGEDIDLAWHPAPELWPVKLDPSQVDQILANLCVNARDAIEDVGKVTIETGNMTLDAAYSEDHPGFLPGDFVRLAVSDDGCGMDRETVDKIFEPFFTTKGVGRGTGLGLSTVFGIVKQNEGFINVYSEPGKGTTFKIYLPRHGGGPADERRPTAEAAVTGHGETVLVVEDDPAILKLTARILAPLNYRVLKARAPKEAIDVAKSHGGDIQLLLTDVVMPDMNGRELSETLVKLHPEIKTLFMSGYTADVIAHRGVLDADVHFLHKPFSKQQLAAKVREALDDDIQTV